MVGYVPGPVSEILGVVVFGGLAGREDVVNVANFLCGFMPESPRGLGVKEIGETKLQEFFQRFVEVSAYDHVP